MKLPVSNNKSQGEIKMRTFIFTLIFSIIVFMGVELSAPVVASACDHYFQEQVINGQRYMVEYSCDGSIVNVEPILD
jgi:hypothetical protein